MTKLKILILSSSCPFADAGNVVSNIFNLISQKPNTDVRLLVKNKKAYNNHGITQYNTVFHLFLIKMSGKLKFIISKFVTIKKKERTLFDYYFQDYDHTKEKSSASKILKKARMKPDVIFVFFTRNYVNYKTIYELYEQSNAHILIYMMDMGPMTGGCHYAWNCDGYTNKCGHCPAIYSKSEYDQSRINWEYNRSYIRKTDISVIAGSECQYRQLQKASLFRDKTILKILNGLDSNIFKPANALFARTQFDLPNNKKIVLIGAINLLEKRKGFVQFIEALEILSRWVPVHELHIAIIGQIDNNSLLKIPYNYSVLGKLDYLELPVIFQAVDIFACPSIEDSGPMMISQSIMCGTPVVSFAMGISYDLVRTENTGYIAQLGDSNDFAQGMHNLLTMNVSECKEMRDNCRKIALKKIRNEEFTRQLVNAFTKHIVI